MTACSFCKKAERQSRFAFRRRVVVLANAANEVRICSACVSITREVLQHKRRSL
jgi:flagellar biosynthesis regulator FlbT